MQDNIVGLFNILETCKYNSVDHFVYASSSKEVTLEKIFEQIKPGDVLATYASTDRFQGTVGFKSYTSIEEGLQKVTDWVLWGEIKNGI